MCAALALSLLAVPSFAEAAATEETVAGESGDALGEDEMKEAVLAYLATCILGTALEGQDAEEMMSMVLFINACVRNKSRTKRLTDHLLSEMEDEVKELRLEEVSFPHVNETFLRERDRLVGEKRFSSPIFDMARDFASADVIVIAAPYWDLSFPAVLKQYLEQINVVGITFSYTEDGVPQGLCRATQLYYVTTAGGNYVPDEYGFGYVKALAQGFYGIGKVECIKATGLDIIDADEDDILERVMEFIGKKRDVRN